jgi:hypothetical protein
VALFALFLLTISCVGKHEVKDLCDTYLAKLEAENSSSDTINYWEPLRAACKTNKPAIMETALSCVEKLIAHGHLKSSDFPEPVADPVAEQTRTEDIVEKDDAEDQATGKSEQSAEKKTRTDQIIDTICGTMNITKDELDNVQLQVIKVLLTAVTSQTFEVHTSSLLAAFRTCYHIQIASKNPTNQFTARAALIQMLSTVFQRMNSLDVTTAARSEEAGDASPNKTLQSLVHKDAFLLFRALCRLSMKPIEMPPGVIALRSKVLSLELILSVLDFCGKVISFKLPRVFFSASDFFRPVFFFLLLSCRRYAKAKSSSVPFVLTYAIRWSKIARLASCRWSGSQ